MSLAKKLNLKPGTKLRVIGKPKGVDLGDVVVAAATAKGKDTEAVLLFAQTAAEVEAKAEPVVDAAKADRVSWVAYPKAGQLGTDLNRDRLREQMLLKGVDAVRQVALDEVWSALRFRPGK